MRKVLYSVAMSLDGYIAGPQGQFDWIPDEPTMDWEAFMERFDMALMGRGTYEVTAGLDVEGGPPPLPTYVFSTTLEEIPEAHMTLVRDDPAEIVRTLKQQPGKTIWLLGGGVLFAHLLAAELVDQVEVALVPILLGRGIRVLPDFDRHVSLRLLESKSYPGGITLLTYDVVA